MAGCLVIAVGCGGRSPLDLPAGGEPASAPDDSSISTATGFCVAYEAEFAKVATRCFGAAPPADVQAAFVADLCPPLDGLVAAGRAVYNRANAAACLAEVESTWAASCRFDDVPCVYHLIAGPLLDGAPCSSSAECQGSSSCERMDPTTCGPPVCTPRGGLGDRCGAECGDGLVCASDGSDVCVLDTGRVGAACDPTATAPCDFTFACGSQGGGEVCRASATGDACRDDFECPVEDFCDGTCHPRLRVGASCVDATQGCVALATCDATTGRCVGAGLGGGPCGLNGFCFDGGCTTTLAFDPPICLVRQPAGAACDAPAQCASGVCMNGACADCRP